jgi:hypothetical protein
MLATHSIKLLESFYNVEYTWPGVGVKEKDMKFKCKIFDFYGNYEKK